MATFTVHQAKTNLSKLIEQAEAGEEVVIARGDKPAVKLVPVPKKHPKRVFGAYKGEATVTDAFFEPLPDDELAGFEGAYSSDPISVEQRKAERKRARRKP
jgi:prevent-host-death family protein